MEDSEDSVSSISEFSDEGWLGSSSSDDELLLLTIRQVRSKRIWVHDINKRRNEQSEYNRLCRELESHEDRFFWYFHMSQPSFEELHELIKPYIMKQTTNYREAISSRERLAVCLRYIRTGDSFLTISFSFRLGRSTVSQIVEEVSKAIWDILQPIYMPNPTEEIWKQSELGYKEIWNFPNCVGSLDGKHVRIKCPINSGSDYYCYKSHFSIVLLAIADPFYKFTVVDVGSYGRHSDSNIFESSLFFRQHLNGNSLLPPKPLPGTSEPVPHVLIGDEGFALQTYLMRPFPRMSTIHDPRKRNYNYRLCRARRIVENTFGILADKWRVLHRPMECSVEKSIHIVKAACILHNYVRIKHGTMLQIPVDDVNTPAPAAAPPQNALMTFRHTNQRSPNSAYAIREKFVSYFNQ